MKNAIKNAMHGAVIEIPGYAALVKPEWWFAHDEQITLSYEVLDWFGAKCLDNKKWKGQWVGTKLAAGLLSPEQIRDIAEYLKLYFDLVGAHSDFIFLGEGNWLMTVNGADPCLQ